MTLSFVESLKTWARIRGQIIFICCEQVNVLGSGISATINNNGHPKQISHKPSYEDILKHARKARCSQQSDDTPPLLYYLGQYNIYMRLASFGYLVVAQ